MNKQKRRNQWQISSATHSADDPCGSRHDAFGVRLVFALPGDPVKAMFGDKPVNEAVAAQIRAEYNLDKPFIVQYLLFLKNALTLDFGKTSPVSWSSTRSDVHSRSPSSLR